MDFTYFAAAIIGAITGIATSFVLNLATARARVVIIIAIVASFLLSVALLLNWAAVTPILSYSLFGDILIIALFSSIGCFVGAMPGLLLRLLRDDRKRSGTS